MEDALPAQHIERSHVYAMAVLCLIAGLGIGYLMRSSVLAAPSTQRAAISAAHGAMPAGHSLEEWKHFSDQKAAPLLEKLKSNPNDTSLLTQVAALYHTTHRFAEAADYYNRAVNVDPANASFRIKLASSLYRNGDIDGAIAQLNTALNVEPKNANALYDLGMIKLQGKGDSKGAVAAWQRLLKSNPDLSPDRKAAVMKVMASAMQMMGDQHGAGVIMQPTKLQFQWTARNALIFVTICLMAGITGGWFLRGFKGISQPSITQAAVAQPNSTIAANTATAAPQPSSPARLKEMADSQAAPLLAKLNADPKNPDLLSSIGNLYYDAQQYPIAVDYYGRALQARPTDVSVRTDMATAYWYLGNADEAITQFNKALAYGPTNPNTLFNLGIVKWQSKHDAHGAIADWKKLLAANPNYDQKDKVQQMLTDVEKQTSSKPGA